MGPRISKEKQKWRDNVILEDENEEIESEKKQKMEIEQRIEELWTDLEKTNAEELQEEGKKALEAIEKRMKEYEEQRNSYDDNILKIEQDIASQIEIAKEKKMNEIQRKHLAETEQLKEEYQNGKEKLNDLMHQKVREKECLTDIIEQGYARRAKMEEDVFESDKVMTKEHNEKLLELRRLLDGVLEQEEQKLKQMINENNAIKQRLEDKRRGQNELKMLTFNSLMDGISSDRKHFDIQGVCLSIVEKFSKFKKDFYTFETCLLDILREMKADEKELSDLSFSKIRSSFNDFIVRVESFIATKPHEALSRTKTSLEAAGEQFKQLLTEIDLILITYESGADSFEQLRNKFSELRKLVKEMSNLVLEFNIEPSNEFQNAIEASFRELVSAGTSYSHLMNGTEERKALNNE